MDRLQKLNGYIQLTVWIVILVGIVFMIFIFNSPHWAIMLLFGLVIQIAGQIVNAIKGKTNRTWLILTLITLLILGITYLESHDVIRLRIFHDMQITILSILAMNVLYFMTIFQIIKEFRSSSDSGPKLQ